MRGDSESIRKDVDYALETLGVDYIDTIVLCRVPSDVTIEEAILGMKMMVDEGKAKYIGVSEANASIIRRAHAVHPLHCIEQEWSLWSRDLEVEIVPTCRELGIKIVAYSPLGRGFLTGTMQNRNELNLDPNDYRMKAAPKFAEENFEHNASLVRSLHAIAARKSCTIGQLSLAWLHSKGPDVIPIPGTTSIDHFDENYAALHVLLSSEDVAEIESIFTTDAAKGQRYIGNHNTFHSNH
jgi:aryl-alcohol dehydrogenase-like predicted oxidoreductase